MEGNDSFFLMSRRFAPEPEGSLVSAPTATAPPPGPPRGTTGSGGTEGSAADFRAVGEDEDVRRGLSAAPAAGAPPATSSAAGLSSAAILLAPLLYCLTVFCRLLRSSVLPTPGVVVYC